MLTGATALIIGLHTPQPRVTGLHMPEPCVTGLRTAYPHVTGLHAPQPLVTGLHMLEPHVTGLQAPQPHVTDLHTPQAHVVTGLHTSEPHLSYVYRSFNNYILLLFFCADVDECAYSKGRCHQVCVNTVGSYTCNCTAPYFTLNRNGYSCDGRLWRRLTPRIR